MDGQHGHGTHGFSRFWYRAGNMAISFCGHVSAFAAGAGIASPEGAFGISREYVVFGGAAGAFGSAGGGYGRLSYYAHQHGIETEPKVRYYMRDYAEMQAVSKVFTGMVGWSVGEMRHKGISFDNIVPLILGVVGITLSARIKAEDEMILEEILSTHTPTDT